MTHPVRDALKKVAEAPEAFDLFQVLRRIEALSPDRPRLGQSTAPGQDPVRLGQPPSMAFAPRPIAGVANVQGADGEDGEGKPARLEAHGFGLFGPNGPLPSHLTEHAFSRQHHAGDESFARFADVFHHRLLSLFFRAWAESEPTVSRDRPDEDRFGVYVASLAGLGMASLRDRDAMPDLAKLHFAGRLASHTRNPEGLEAILSSFFEAPVEIREFAPKWVSLPPSSLCQLGRDPETGTLGSTLTAGARIKVHHHRFRIVIGPLGLAAYERLLPGGLGLVRLMPIVRNYVGDELDFEVNLVLHHDEVPAVRLGVSGRIGFTGWIGRRRAGEDAREFLKTATAVAAEAAAPRSPSALMTIDGGDAV